MAVWGFFHIQEQDEKHRNNINSIISVVAVWESSEAVLFTFGDQWNFSLLGNCGAHFTSWSKCIIPVNLLN